jgi:hypothetical protein
MKRIQLIRMAVVALFASVTLITPGMVSAADSVGSSNGMKVAPVKTELVINPGESKTINVSLQNITDGQGTYKTVVNDFQAKDETGAPSLLLDGKANPNHGLKQYMTVASDVSIAAGAQKDIPVTVTIPKGAAGGGYYGAVRFVPASQANGKNVSLSGSVASLILVRVAGNITENLQIASLDVRKGENAGTLFTSGNNLKASVRFRNSGNVQEQPFGKILLKKGDKVLGTYEVNNTDNKSNVLPDSIRRYDIDLKDVGSFGKYKLEANFGYGSAGQLLSATTTFYVVPLYFIVPAIVLVGLLILAVVLVPRMIKNYNKRILNRAGRR